MNLLNFDPREPRIRLAHKRLHAAYARADNAALPIVEPGVRHPHFPPRETVKDLEVMLAHAAGWANALAATDNDWPPFIDTYCTVVMVAEAFGCRVVYPGSGDAWTEPAVTDIARVWDLKPMKPREAPLVRRLAEWVDCAQRRLGVELPIWTVDIQSPFSVAAHIVEPTQLLMACITHPKAVHHVCRMVTDFTIEVMRQHIRQMEHPGFPGRNFPSISEDIGICIADDTPLIMLSPDMYREFALPYNSEIGAAFGGVHIHSCGDYRGNLENLLSIINIRSIQLHAGPGEFPLPGNADEDCVLNRARERLTLFVDTNPVARGEQYADQPRAHYERYVLPRLLSGDTTGLILQSCGTGEGVPNADKALAWTHERVAEMQRA